MLLVLALSLTLASPDVLQSHLDTSISPRVDFFQYANGGWFKKNPIPPAESTWGINNEVRDDLYARLRTVNEKAAKSNAAEGTDDQKVGDFWTTGLDENKAEEEGLKPLQPYLDKINAVTNLQQAIDTGFRLHEIGVNVFCDFSVSQDERASDVETVYLSQGGLGLPDRSFYFNPEAGVAKVRAAYVPYIEGILQLAGSAEDAKQEAEQVFAFETELAKISRKREDLRDPEKNYNKMPVAEVTAKLDPSIDWPAELTEYHVQPHDVVVGQPEFFTGLEDVLKKTPIEDLKAYMRFHLISAYAPYLNKAADDLDFKFRHTVMSGQKEEQPRWKRVMTAENRAIGFILGRAFVKEYFPPSAKKRYSDLIEAIRSAYHKRIDALTWMSPETKKKAHEKLAAMIKKVGYPDKWKDYSALKIGRTSFCDNMLSAAQWRVQDNFSKFGKPVYRLEWGITPQTFNAYYNPLNNEIVMPAAAFAIPGLRDSEIDEALMYGNAAASWIGHEMTHGFDDEGRHFDAKGNLTDWWTKADAERFSQGAELMVKQFDAYEPIRGIHINGKACLGENIADYGGVLLGIDAFKQSRAYKEDRIIGGLTPMQRFFLGYALSWMDQQREESLRSQLLSDVHAPAKYRVIGPLSNIPEFYEAFGVKPGDPMWRAPELRPHIW